MSAYIKINTKYSFLLESVEQGEKIGRYSIIGYKPLIFLQGFNDHISVIKNNNRLIYEGDSMTHLKNIYSSIEYEKEGDAPISNGFFGHFTWEIISKIENISFNANNPSLFEFQIPSYLIVFDHFQQSIFITISSHSKITNKDYDPVLDTLNSRLDFKSFESVNVPKQVDWNQVESNYTKSEYEEAVEKVKEYIVKGDIFQGVISQKFSVPKMKDPLSVYRALRHINPSPYMYYFNYEEYQIIGSSPEILVQSMDNRATVRPIAGTRKRTFKNEMALVEELKSDEKEIAEHIMLVDLGRNDLGRVCNFQSIKITDLMTIEKYSHVIHMVTNVEGALLDNVTPIDLLKATFPAGTVSGAPKIRAIEIINELEPEARHIYSGAIGYFNFDGDVDLCIGIRTIISKNNRYYVQAGAGIVYDSVPEKEYEETKSKAQGILLACFEGDPD